MCSQQHADRRRLEALQAIGCRTLALDVTDLRESMVHTVKRRRGRQRRGWSAGQQRWLWRVRTRRGKQMSTLRRQLETNVVGLTRLTQLVLPHMRAQRWGAHHPTSAPFAGAISFPGCAYTALRSTPSKRSAMHSASRSDLWGRRSRSSSPARSRRHSMRPDWLIYGRIR